MTRRKIIVLLCFFISIIAVYVALRLLSGSPFHAGRVVSPGKVVLIGIDGATFKVLKPLVENGEAPAFKQFMDDGAYAPLLSEYPMFSPIVWTTICTGVSPKQHAIDHLLHYLPEMGDDAWRMYNSQDRQAFALWNLVSWSQKTVGMIGFWNTWPAEKLNGYIISDHVAYSKWMYFDTLSYSQTYGLTYPRDLYEKIKPLVIQPDDLSSDMISSLAPFTREDIDRIKTFERPHVEFPGSHLKFGFLNQLSYENISFKMLEDEPQPDLLGIYLVATDYISHKYWHYYEPEKFKGVSLEKARRMREVIPGIYRHNDQYLSDLLKRISTDSTLIFVSDHGFQASGHLPGESEIEENSGKHHIHGIFIAWGKNIRPGIKLKEASIYDIAPTILALLDMPVPENFPGRALTEIIDKDFLEKYPVRSIPPLEPRTVSKPATLKSAMEKYYVDNLRSLGYIR